MYLFYEIIIIGLILGSDSFSVAVAMGLRPFSKKDAIKFATIAAITGTLTTFIGAIAGLHVLSKIQSFDHWIAFGLLLAVAIHMAYEGLQDLMGKKEKTENIDFHSIGKILIVSFATNIDSFGVGIGIGVAQKPIMPYIFSIGIWGFLLTIAGLYLAKKLSDKFGSIVSLIGAIILAAIAFKMLEI